MDLLVVVLITAGWLALLVFVLALCKMAARGDAAQERLQADQRRLDATEARHLRRAQTSRRSSGRSPLRMASRL